MLPGKPAQPLSEHYQLDCDYGTALITIYKEGEGSDPIYLCDAHAAAMERSDDNGPIARSIEAQSDDSTNPMKSDDRARAPEFAAAEPVASAPSETVDTPAAAIVGRETESPFSAIGPSDENGADACLTEPQSDGANSPAKTDDRAQAPKFPAAESIASAPSKPVGAPAATRVGREIKGPSPSGPVRDLTFGNSAKALVDETIWNMAPGDYEAYRTALRQGKSAAEAARAAGGQLAIVHRKISDYTLKIEAVLSESNATINVDDVINKPLEHAMLNIIGSSAMSDAEKDAAMDHLGGLQEWMNRGLAGEMTPLQAHRIARSIGDRTNWGLRSSLSEAWMPAYRAVYLSIRNAARTAVPDAHELDDRLANLSAARCDLESAPAAKP